MLDVAGLTFPASTVLAAWSRQLAPWQPEALWVGHLFLYRVEALASSSTVTPLDRFPGLVLQALALIGSSPDGVPLRTTLLEQLRRRLQLPEAILSQVVQSLLADGLLQPDWALEEAGRQALVTGAFARRDWRRQAFTFVQRPDGDAGRPVFAAVDGAASAEPWAAAPPWHDSWLRDCLAQSPTWKESCGFPGQVLALADSAPAEVPSWQRVTMVRPQRLPAAIVLGRQGSASRLLGFAARGPSLQAAAPILSLAPEFEELAAGLMPSPGPEAIHRAWIDWCESHGVLSPLVAGCRCTLEGLALRVQAPPVLMHELRGKRCGLDGQEWRLLGAGPMRRAAAIWVTAL